jgi:sporulation-control protein
MVFRSLRRRMGVGGPAVDTVLDDPSTRPGETLTGAVHLTGGERDREIERVRLTLVTRIGAQTVELATEDVAGEFTLAKGALIEVPLRLFVPLETPVTHLFGERVPGLAVGVRTDLEVAFAADPDDMDHVAVHPRQDAAAALEAFRELGFRFKAAGPAGFEFWTAPQYQDVATAVSVGFTTRPDELEVILNGRVHATVERRESVHWVNVVDRLVRQIGQI